MKWEVLLTGPSSILDELTRAFRADPQCTIAKIDGGYALRSDAFNDFTDAADVRAEATRIVEALSGIARVLLQGTDRLAISSVVQIESGGRRNIFVAVTGAELRMTAGLVGVQMIHQDGTVAEWRPSDPAPKWLKTALANPSAARALRLRDTDVASWPDLYRLFEVIAAGAGGTGSLAKYGWASQKQMKRFKHTADSVAAAGDQARHGVERTAPPPEPMTIAEARSFVDMLLARWLGQDGL